MYPEKHFRDHVNSLKRRAAAKKAVIATSFLGTTFFAAPLLHEVSHISVLLWQGCPYTSSFELVSTGLRANVKPLCSIEGGELALFYLSGYTATGITGAILEIAASKTSTWRKTLAAASVGTFLSIMFSIGRKGDINHAAETLGIGIRSSAIIAVSALIALYFGLKATEILLSERQEGKTN